MSGAPKSATTAYVFYCNEKRLLVAQIGRNYRRDEKQPFVDKHVDDKVRYQRELEAFKVIVGAEKVDELEEANKAEQEGKKRKKAIEKVDRDATKRQRILELKHTIRFDGMASLITTDDASIFAATNGKAAIAARGGTIVHQRKLQLPIGFLCHKGIRFIPLVNQ
eukprot:scaffold398573_cov59-Attheya_sp.AAC.1